MIVKPYLDNNKSVYASSKMKTRQIQSLIEKIGENGTIHFMSGIYNTEFPLIPLNNQTWILEGARFHPTCDTRILTVINKQRLFFKGTLFINDVDLKSFQEAVYIEDMQFSYFENIVIENYYKAMSLFGDIGTNENDFNNVNFRYIRHQGLSLSGQCHDNHFKHVFVKGPSPTEFATGPGIYIGTDGVQGGNIFTNVEVLDMHKGLDLPGAFEVWFGTVIADNAYNEAIFIGGNCEKLSFDTIWASSSGDGVIIAGNNTALPVTLADKIKINKIYTFINANYGIKFAGYCKNININSLTTERNIRGLGMFGPMNDEIVIDNLVSVDNVEWGVDGAGCGKDCSIGKIIKNDTVFNLENFVTFNEICHRGEELLENSAVDLGEDNPTNWSHSETGTGWSENEFRSSPRSLWLGTLNTTAEWRSDYFPVIENTLYRLAGFFKGEGSSETFLTIRWFSDSAGTNFISEQNISLNSVYTDWTQIILDTTSPAGALSADVLFRCPSNTTVSLYGDDFTVRGIV